jgi:hypothetical protein
MDNADSMGNSRYRYCILIEAAKACFLSQCSYSLFYYCCIDHSAWSPRNGRPGSYTVFWVSRPAVVLHRQGSTVKTTLNLMFGQSPNPIRPHGVFPFQRENVRLNTADLLASGLWV